MIFVWPPAHVDLSSLKFLSSWLTTEVMEAPLPVLPLSSILSPPCSHIRSTDSNEKHPLFQDPNHLFYEVKLLTGSSFYVDRGTSKFIFFLSRTYTFFSSSAPFHLGARQAIIVRDNNTRAQIKKLLGIEGLILTLLETKGELERLNLEGANGRTSRS